MQRIVLPPSREEFKAFIEPLFFPEAGEVVMKAWDWCGEWHGDQPLRQDGSNYQDHPRAAAWILLREIGVKDPETIVITLLHDVGEVKHKKPPTHEELCEHFGYRIAYKVEALTKAPGEDVETYSRQVFAEGGTKGVIAKFADRLHNLRTLGACPIEKRVRIIADTWIHYDPFTGNYKNFFHDVSPNDEARIQLLWRLMKKAINRIET